MLDKLYMRVHTQMGVAIGMSYVFVLQVRHVCAGTAARTMAQAIIHPIDTVKTRLQVRLALQPLISYDCGCLLCSASVLVSTDNDMMKVLCCAAFAC